MLLYVHPFCTSAKLRKQHMCRQSGKERIDKIYEDLLVRRPIGVDRLEQIGASAAWRQKFLKKTSLTYSIL